MSMSRIKATINVPVAAAALALGAVAGYQALAQRGDAPAPTAIATIRIDVLFDGLVERAEAKAQIAAMEDELTAEQERRQAAITQKLQAMDDVVAAASKEALADEIHLLRLKLQFWFQEARAELEIEKALRLQLLYDSIKKAIADLANTEGYDIVLLNDSGGDLPFDRESRIPPQLQVLQQITSRKILFQREAVDITEDLSQRMNNQFRAARAGP